MATESDVMGGAEDKRPREQRESPVPPSGAETVGVTPEPRLASQKEAVQKVPQNAPTTGPNNNPLYLALVAIVAIIAVAVISMSDSANSSAVIGLITIASTAAGGMAGVAYQKRQD